MNRIQDSLFEAMAAFRNSAITNSKGTLTLETVVTQVIDAGLGEYSVEYMENTFTAYSNSNATYSVGDKVYVLVPEGDFNKTKIILSLVSPATTTFTESQDPTQYYYDISENLIDANLGIVELSSYKDESVETDITSRVDIADVLNAYLENGHRTFKINLSALTSLAIDQQQNGNYGVKIKLPLISNSADGEGITELVQIAYILDVDSMLGNPYRFEAWAPQAVYFTLDEQYSIAKVDENNNPIYPTITYFCEGFTQDSTKENIKDIKLTDIGFYVSDAISSADTQGYFLTLKATDGNYFSTTTPNPKTITPTLKVNNRPVNLTADSCEVYWFKEDVSVVAGGTGYAQVGGPGWYCLNRKTNLTLSDDGKETFDWVTSDITLQVTRADVRRKLTYKCVVVYDGQQSSRELTLSDLESQIEFSLRTSSGSLVYLKDTGYVNVIARVKFSENISEETVSTGDAKYREDVIYNWRFLDINGQPVDIKYTLVRHNEIVDGAFETEIQFPVNNIQDRLFIYCTSKWNTGGSTVTFGTESLIVTTSVDIDYTLTIHGDKITYLYDVQGNSPMGTAYSGPPTSKVTSIEPLSFTIRDKTGQELTKAEYSYIRYKWIIPKHSLFVVSGAEEDENGDYYFEGYDTNHSFVLNYDIASRYNMAYSKRFITLQIEFQGKFFEVSPTIIFSKDGENGTNGMGYKALMVSGGSTPDTSVAYGTPDAHGLAKKLKFLYNISSDGNSGTLYRYDYDSHTLVAEADNTSSKRIFTQVWRNGNLLTYQTQYTLEYSMYAAECTDPFFELVGTRDTYGRIVPTMDSYGGVLIKVKTFGEEDLPITLSKRYCTIICVKVTVTEDNSTVSNSNKIIYAYYPIELTLVNNMEDILEEVPLIPSLEGGFSEVEYRTDGTEPICDETSNFKIYGTGPNDEPVDIEDYYNITWEAQHHLTTSRVIKPNDDPEAPTEYYKSEVKVSPHMTYDTGDAKNYVAATLTLNKTLNELNAEITALETANIALETANTRDTNNLSYLTHFASAYDVDTWLSTLDTIQELLNKKTVAYNLLKVNLAQQIELFENYLTEEKNENNLPIDSVCSVLLTEISNLKAKSLLEQTKIQQLGKNYGYNDLSELGSYKLTWNDTYQTQLGLNVGITIKNCITIINMLIDDYDTNKLADLTSLSGTTYLATYVGIYTAMVAMCNSSPTPTEDRIVKLKTNCLNDIENLFVYVSYVEVQSFLKTFYNRNLSGIFSYGNGTLAVNDATSAEYTKNRETRLSTIDENESTIEDRQSMKNSISYSIVYIRPIVLYFNRYEMSNINAWDGNKIETGDGSYLLAPQVGAGIKEADNSFTGIVIGRRNLNSDGVSHSTADNQVGMFGYSSGRRSIFLNARNGSAIFGISGYKDSESEESVPGGQIIIDPSTNKSVIYSNNYWTNYDKWTGLPSSYAESNKSGEGMMIDFTDGKIMSKKHSTLDSDVAGLYLSEDGISIGEKFFVNAEDGSMRIGSGAVKGNTQTHRFWTVDVEQSIDEGYEDLVESFIAFGGRFRYDEGRENDPRCAGQIAQVYVGTDGISLGRSLSINRDGQMTIGGGGPGDNVGGWRIYPTFLASFNYQEGTDSGGVRLDSANDYIALGSSEGKLFSGMHSEFESILNGFYLSGDGLSIGEGFRVDQFGSIYATEGFIGGYRILTASEDGNTLALEHSHNAWKLRSAALSDNDDDRYYAYLTKAKNFIVTNAKDGPHKRENDVTYECQIGSYHYPWGAGYYKKLRVGDDVHNYCDAVPESVIITLADADWEQHQDGYYYQDMVINGVQRIGHEHYQDDDSNNIVHQQLEIVPTESCTKAAYLCELSAYSWALEDKPDNVRFMTTTRPQGSMTFYFLIEGFKDAYIDPPILFGNFDDEISLLTLAWNSPDDSSVFITWKYDMVTIEEYDETTRTWDPIYTKKVKKANKYSDTPLEIYG